MIRISHLTEVEGNFGTCHPRMALNNSICSVFLYFTPHHGWRKFGICHSKTALNYRFCISVFYTSSWLKKILEFVTLKWSWITVFILYFCILHLTVAEENFGICHPKMALNNAIYLIFLYFTLNHGWRKFWNFSP